MEKSLTRSNGLYHHVNNEEVSGPNPQMSGDCTGLSGSLDECKLTQQERESSVSIAGLIREAKVKKLAKKNTSKGRTR